MATLEPAGTAVDRTLAGSGFHFVTGAEMRAMLAATGSLDDWASFADSWGDLELDTFMGDGGRYRTRRHAVFTVSRDGTSEREPHQPHYQGRDYNALNGGIDRWFAPVTEAVGASASLATILRFCGRLFSGLSPSVAAWKTEIHQFRIAAKAGEAGKPTPEGMHRDGVDWVLVLLIRRHNIQSGTTTIADLGKTQLGSFTLTAPFDAALVDDSRVYHGVTPIEPIDANEPAWRDVLVVTFRDATR